VFADVRIGSRVARERVRDGARLFGEQARERIGIAISGDDADFQIFQILFRDKFFGECFTRVFFGNEIDFEVQIFDGFLRAGTDAGDAARTEATQIFEAFEKFFEKSAHAVCAGEHEPIVFGNHGKNFRGNGFIAVERDFDERHFHDFGAASRERIAQSGVVFFRARDDDAPILKFLRHGADFRSLRERFQIEIQFVCALFSGLPSLAAEIARDALGEKNLSNAEREQLLLTLSGAQLALGDYAAADASIEGIAGDSPRRKLREAFVAVSRERYSEALAALDGLSAEAFPREERAWFFLARGIAGAFLFGSDSARADFDAAAADAGSEALREHIAFLRMWADVSARANVPAEELSRLKAARDAARGTPDFARAAKLHIVALAKSGQREAALAALRECVPVPGKNVAEFDLLEGLLAEKMSGEAARAAFERVVRARPSRALQSAAFSGLLQGVRDFQNAGKKEEAILAANAIEKFLSSLAPDESVRDLELFTRARLAFDIGNLRLSETLADELNSRFPASPFVPDSLRLLVGIAVKEKEYRRAVPLLERLLSTELSPEERVQTDVLIADCRFLSGDYALAADAYARKSLRSRRAVGFRIGETRSRAVDDAHGMHRHRSVATGGTFLGSCGAREKIS